MNSKRNLNCVLATGNAEESGGYIFRIVMVNDWNMFLIKARLSREFEPIIATHIAHSFALWNIVDHLFNHWSGIS